MTAKPKAQARKITLSQDWDGQLLNAMLVAMTVIDDAVANGDQDQKAWAEHANGLVAGVLRKNVTDDEMAAIMVAFKHWPRGIQMAYPEAYMAYCAANPSVPVPFKGLRVVK